MKFKIVVIGIIVVSISILFSQAARGQTARPKTDTTPSTANQFLGTTFTYQGVIEDTKGAVNGRCDIQFSLWDENNSGSKMGTTQTTTDVQVTNGVFTVHLNGADEFGTAAFNGHSRWLQLAVRCPAGTGSYHTLQPRQMLTAVPYAQHAASASAANTSPWNGLTGIPAGFDDNVDNNTTYTAGSGLSLNSTTFRVKYSGSGSANNAARADHNHFDHSWTGTAATGLEVNNNATNGIGIKGNSFDGNGLEGHSTGDFQADYGVRGVTNSDVTSKAGVYGENINGGSGVYGTTTASDNNYGFYTPDNSYSLNHTVAAGFSILAQNGGQTPLEVGDIVTLSGMAAPLPDANVPLMLVELVNGAPAHNIVGVVQTAYQIETTADPENPAKTNVTHRSLAGPAPPGTLILLRIQGIAQVKADGGAAGIQAGDYLVVSQNNGRATSLSYTTTANKPEGTIIGTAMEPLTQKTGLIWVLVDLR